MSYEYARGTVPTVGYVETEGPNDFLTVSHCTGIVSTTDSQAFVATLGLAALGTRGRGPRSGRAWSSRTQPRRQPEHIKTLVENAT